MAPDSDVQETVRAVDGPVAELHRNMFDAEQCDHATVDPRTFRRTYQRPGLRRSGLRSVPACLRLPNGPAIQSPGMNLVSNRPRKCGTCLFVGVATVPDQGHKPASVLRSELAAGSSSAVFGGFQ